MSTILKALRRLEREKQPEPGKPLREDVVAFVPGEPQEPGSRRTLGWLGAAVGGVALLLGAFWLASAPGEREAPPEPGAGSSPAPARVPRAAAIPPAPAPSTLSQALPARKATPPTLARAAPAPVPTEAEAAPAEARPYRLPDPEPLEAFQAPELAPRPEPAPRSAEVEPAPAPVPLPEARVESTTWHPDPDRRRAIVSAAGRSGVSLQEGDAIGELVVLRVEPAGVVFLFQGREITRRVGE